MASGLEKVFQNGNVLVYVDEQCDLSVGRLENYAPGQPIRLRVSDQDREAKDAFSQAYRHLYQEPGRHPGFYTWPEEVPMTFTFKHDSWIRAPHPRLRVEFLSASDDEFYS